MRTTPNLRDNLAVLEAHLKLLHQEFKRLRHLGKPVEKILIDITDTEDMIDQINKEL